MIKECLGLSVLAAIYTIAMIIVGVLLEYSYVRRVLPDIENHSFMDGVRACTKFAEDQRQRDTLQGVQTRPVPIQ